MKVSYCSTCKGRLHQLKSTLIPNLLKLQEIDAEWIIIDYNCPDNTKEVLFELPIVKYMMSLGKLKLYSFKKDIPFNMPLSKNMSHSLAEGDVVFNLDIDNFIGDSFESLSILRQNEYLTNNEIFNKGVNGRIGLHRNVFNRTGGYDLDLDEAGFDDINFIKRLNLLKLRPTYESNIQPSIPNNIEDTVKYSSNPLYPLDVFRKSKIISDENILNGKLIVNPKGSLFYKEEDMSTYIERVQ